MTKAGRRVIRVILADEPAGWGARFCTDPAATVTGILTAVADQLSLEVTFRDCKEGVGAGQQQVRFVRANIGVSYVCLRTFTMAEAWTPGRADEELVDRSDSPWHSPLRRPSHADKRRARRRALLGEEIRAALRPGVSESEIRATAERLLRLAAYHESSYGKCRRNETHRGCRLRDAAASSPQPPVGGGPGGPPGETVTAC